MNDYRAVYKNTGLTPRSLNDAYRGADYATPIYRHENREWIDAKNFFTELAVCVGFALFISVFGYSILVLFGVVS